MGCRWVGLVLLGASLGCRAAVGVETTRGSTSGIDEGTGDVGETAAGFSMGSGVTSGADPTSFGTTSDTTTAATSTDASTGGGYPSSACSMWAQDCPAGEKCNPYATEGSSWNANGCFPVVDDPAQPGERCEVFGSGTSGFDTCAVGAVCMWAGEVNEFEGECVASCEGNPSKSSCPDPATVCSIANRGVLSLCLQACDPADSQCAEGFSCTPVDTEYVCAPEGPRPPGPGSPCSASKCPGGTTCIGAEAYGLDCDDTACCSAWCSISAPRCPTPGHVCTSAWPRADPPRGWEDVGVCTSPS